VCRYNLCKAKGSYGHSVLSMQEGFTNGHVLVHAYANDGTFKVHLDQNSRGVALWSLGRTARFAVCLSGQCERHHSIAKPTCPHCFDFDFESGAVVAPFHCIPVCSVLSAHQ
jgi:hypothetical protein